MNDRENNIQAPLDGAIFQRIELVDQTTDQVLDSWTDPDFLLDFDQELNWNYTSAVQRCTIAYTVKAVEYRKIYRRQKFVGGSSDVFYKIQIVVKVLSSKIIQRF